MFLAICLYFNLEVLKSPEKLSAHGWALLTGGAVVLTLGQGYSVCTLLTFRTR